LIATGDELKIRAPVVDVKSQGPFCIVRRQHTLVLWLEHRAPSPDLVTVVGSDVTIGRSPRTQVRPPDATVSASAAELDATIICSLDPVGQSSVGRPWLCERVGAVLTRPAAARQITRRWGSNPTLSANHNCHNINDLVHRI
jgi:hypothetical protein